MKVRSLIPVASLLVSSLTVFSASAPEKSWQLCGPNIVSTSASNAEVVSAVHATHKTLTKQPLRTDGTVQDKSFTQDLTRGESAGKTVLRYKAGFQTKSGAAVRIDYVTKPQEETLVFFEGNDPAAVEEARDQFVAALEQQGVRQAQ